MHFTWFSSSKQWSWGHSSKMISLLARHPHLNTKICKSAISYIAHVLLCPLDSCWHSKQTQGLVLSVSKFVLKMITNAVMITMELVEITLADFFSSLQTLVSFERHHVSIGTAFELPLWVFHATANLSGQWPHSQLLLICIPYSFMYMDLGWFRRCGQAITVVVYVLHGDWESLP